MNLTEEESISVLIDNFLAKNNRKTINILNENNYKNDDCIIIIRTLLSKLKKILITDYQIISPILNIYDNSPNQWHHPSVSFPLKSQKYYDTYKNYFIKKIKKYKINYIFETRSDEKIITSFLKKT